MRVQLEPLAEADWGRRAPSGSRSRSHQPGPGVRADRQDRLGGELSRFMLALKVVLARLDAAATLIFDEVDAGIGGATADAVGERLARLGEERQVLVVTHAPRSRPAPTIISASARRSARPDAGRGARAGSGERRDEIARMLAGAEVTDAARAAAASLMRVAGPPDEPPPTPVQG